MRPASSTASKASKSPTNDITASLAAFETAIGTPVVPGELDNWCGNVRETFKTLAEQMRNEIQDAHREHFRRIQEEDLALEPRLEQLQREDEDLLARLEEVEHRVHALSSKAPAVEPVEQKAELDVAQLVEDALLLVVRIRKQELAIATWLVEAVARDRGVVD